MPEPKVGKAGETGALRMSCPRTKPLPFRRLLRPEVIRTAGLDGRQRSRAQTCGRCNSSDDEKITRGIREQKSNFPAGFFERPSSPARDGTPKDRVGYLVREHRVRLPCTEWCHSPKIQIDNSSVRKGHVRLLDARRSVSTVRKILLIICFLRLK